MAITAETLIDLILETRRAFVDVDTELSTLKMREAELRLARQQMADEEEAFVASLQRRFPGEEVPGKSPAIEAEDEGNFFQIPEDDWQHEARSDAILRAVKELTESAGVASPGSIEELLHARNRDDSRDAIGASLAYLNRTNRIWRQGRGAWISGTKP